MTRRFWWLPWAALFVLMVFGWKRCAEWYVGDTEGAVGGYDPETWKPCPGRKPVRERGHKYVWYCGPDHPDFLRKNQNDAAAKPDNPYTAKRQSGHVGNRGQNRGQKSDG